MAKIIRVFGKADSFDIEFTEKGGRWEADIPPDFTDGVYAVQLTAVNEFGKKSTWVGELFMCNGVCCVKFNDSPYQVWLRVKDYTVNLSTNYEMIIRKGCCHVRQ